ncbi:MAG: MBL fold metallo-hydrolase [Planctomycetota bacterium]
MRIHQIRNATIVIETGEHSVLVDPMLSKAGTLPAFFTGRFPDRMNPLTELPENADKLLSRITHGLQTHIHFGIESDHLDPPGAALLRDAGVPVYCREGDELTLREHGLDARPLELDVDAAFLGGTIRPVPAMHARGEIGERMGPGVGYVIALPGEPVLYLTGDTIMTDAVRETTRTHRPDVIVAPLGGAQTDTGDPILFALEDAIELAGSSDAVFVANHLGALNHCPVTRDEVRAAATRAGIESRVRVPLDGETLELNG